MPKSTRDDDFKCLNCGYRVSADPHISGVQSRNHCPICLWSRHVDLHASGDRMAACMGLMMPAGLTLKRTQKKYASANSGEMMLIHVCQGCGKVSINRIAADDDAETIWKLFEASSEMETQLKSRIVGDGVQLLESADRQTVHDQLFGRG